MDVDQIAPVNHYFLKQFFELQKYSNEKSCILGILKMMFDWSFYGRGKDRRKEGDHNLLTIFNFFINVFQLNTKS